ncbi:MAG TPA: 5-guanidino-2-oxopentanoate decarboxylase, partial [Steroidobacter sp.]|nr:5-guanidino-2-oxopentanoate decarboxylase [Steroidobacter sp.]
MKSLGRYLVEALHAQGVSHVFGIPGVHNLELYRGLASGPIRHVTGRHEQGVGFMADGYARVSGRPGVCLTITGPGFTNIATAMGQAYGDSIPLLVISSQNRSGEAGSGRGFLHELPDQRSLAEGVASAAFAIRTPADLGVALGQAFESFTHSRPRPIYIEIPLDMGTADMTGVPLPEVPRPPRAPASTIVESIVSRLRAARHPVILVGGGAVRAAKVVQRLAERLDAPVVMTVNARGILPADHALAVPASPTLTPVRQLVTSADLVLAVGTEFGPTDYAIEPSEPFPDLPNLIRVDIDSEQLNRGATPSLGIVGDIATVLAAVEAQDLGQPRKANGVVRAATARAGALDTSRRFSIAYGEHIDVLENIRECLPTAVIVGDSTQLVYAGNFYFGANAPASWFNSATGYGTLGYALPAATGASLAAADRPVVCLVGDGGLQFS